MAQKKIYTTEYCYRHRMNYHAPAGLGFTRMHIFTPTGTGGYSWDVYERNHKTGYCKSVYTGKRISQAKWDELFATTQYAF